MEFSCIKIFKRWTHLSVFKSFHLWLEVIRAERSLMTRFARCWASKVRLTLSMCFDAWRHSSALHRYVQPRIRLILLKWDKNWLANMFRNWLEYLKMVREFHILAILNNVKMLDSPLHQRSPINLKLTSLYRWYLACSRMALFRKEGLFRAKDGSLARAVGDQCLISAFLGWKERSCRQRLEGECNVQCEKTEGLLRRSDKLRENLDRWFESESSMF